MRAPVMMVHGMCCTGDVWSRFRGFFEQRGARVFTPTLRPEARVSSLHKPRRALRELRFSDYVRQLEDEARRIADEAGRRPVVIGHSMGGLLAQVLAERGCVEAAVFITPSPARVDDPIARLFWWGVTLGHTLGVTPWAIRSSRWLADAVVLNVLPAAERAAIHDTFVYESGRAFSELGGWPVDATRVRIPVLTVAAGRDRMVPARLVRLTGAKYAAVGGEFLEYAEHGHWLYAEPGWEKPAGEIYGWLERALARTARTPVQTAAPGV